MTQQTLSRGLLENPLIWQGLVVAAGVAAWVLFRRRRARVTPPQSVPSRLVVIGTLLAMTAVFWLNDYVGYVRTPHDLALLMERGNGWTVAAGQGLADITVPDGVVPTHGRLVTAHNAGDLRILQVPLPDPRRGVPTGVADVLLPPGYDTHANATRRYPVVYLIHGYPDGNADDWFTAGDAMDTMRYLLADGVVQPMIVVSPDMTAEQPTDWECLNVPGGPQLEDYLTDTVVPGIDTRFRTIANRQHRALGGMSGGGYCALNIGLHHLLSFDSLLITLPYDTLGDSAGVLKGNQKLIARNTPRQYIPGMRFTCPMAAIIVAGAGDRGDVATTYRLAEALNRRGQYVAVHIEHGQAHTWRAARAALPYLLDFANQMFGSPTGHPARPVARATKNVKIAATGRPRVSGSRPNRSPAQ